jgi:hypothetical protein
VPASLPGRECEFLGTGPLECNLVGFLAVLRQRGRSIGSGKVDAAADARDRDLQGTPLNKDPGGPESREDFS